MTIKQKTLLWFLIPSVLIATITASFCYFSTLKTVKQNVYDQLEIAAGELQENARVFLEAKEGRVLDFSSDGFIRDCTGVITERFLVGINVEWTQPANTNWVNPIMVEWELSFKR